MKAPWEIGASARIAHTMRESRQELVRRAAITPQMMVLDLACGNGMTAIPAAQLGAKVLGVDIAAIWWPVRLCVQSRPAWGCAAREMVRVTKPGGRFVMSNWIPDDPTPFAQIAEISAACSRPPAEGSVSPMAWGIESNVIERFAAAVARQKPPIPKSLSLRTCPPAVGVSATGDALLAPGAAWVQSPPESDSQVSRIDVATKSWSNAWPTPQPNEADDSASARDPLIAIGAEGRGLLHRRTGQRRTHRSGPSTSDEIRRAANGWQ